MRHRGKPVVERLLSLFPALIAAACVGCTMTLQGEEYQIAKDQEFMAHGRKWIFSLRSRTDSIYYFYGPAIGGAPRPKDILYLYTDKGEKVDLHNQVFALQKDGTKKKVINCCGLYGAGERPLFEYGDKLILHIPMSRAMVTDCAVLPLDFPGSGKKHAIDGNTTYSFFGEFDPNSNSIYIDSSFQGYRDQNEKAKYSGANELMAQYESRVTFNCHTAAVPSLCPEAKAGGPMCPVQTAHALIASARRPFF